MSKLVKPPGVELWCHRLIVTLACCDGTPSAAELAFDTGKKLSSTESYLSKLSSRGLDFEQIANEYLNNGGLSDQTYDALAAAGLSPHYVDQYIAGQEAIAQSVRSQVYNAVGGEEQYMEMVSWAGDNLNANEIAAYNASVNSGDNAQRMLAIDGLRARFTAVNGVTPKLLGGTSSRGQGSGDAFTSTKSMTEAMSDPRYATDPVYRQGVIDKLHRSNIL